jgi:hypothetical protein
MLPPDFLGSSKQAEVEYGIREVFTLDGRYFVPHSKAKSSANRSREGAH